LRLAAAVLGVRSPAIQAQDKVLNVYSARHYPGDVQLYSAFTQATGIQIKRVDADDAGIRQRLKAEGTCVSRRRNPAGGCFAPVACRGGRPVCPR